MLGADLIKIFKEDKNYEVLGWDINEIDITNKKQVKENLSKAKPDIIINAAAYNAVDKCEENEKAFELAKKINGKGPKYLAQAAKDSNAIFIHYVSDYVFDGKKGAYNENDKTNPISNYGISKELGEKNVQNAGGEYYLIRTSKLFGRAAQSTNAKKSFFETMLNLSKDNRELRAVDGEKSCFTYTPDLAEATKKLIEEKYPFGIYHLINEGAVTWYEGLKKLFKIAKINNVAIRPVPPEEFPRPAKRPESSVLINTKFPKLRNYEEALRDWFNG